MRVRRICSLIVAVVTAFSCLTMHAFASSSDISGGELISYNGSKKVYYVPEEVKTIGENAFENCTQLEEIYIGNNVECIKSNAFSNCQNLNLICICDTNVIAFGESIVDKNVLILINNENKSVRKSIAMSGYRWATFSECEAIGKKVLMFFYGASPEDCRAECVGMIIENCSPDYIYFGTSGNYYYSASLSFKEIDYSKSYNPGLFVKSAVMSKTWNMPDKEDIESGNDGAKNGIKRLLNALVKLFK